MLNSRYELIEYVNDVNREYVEVLVEQNINGRTDTTYTYGVDRISMELFNQTSRTSYYLYDPRGSVAGLADTKGHLTKTYQYTVTGELAYGSATYENEYTYNGESYNPNIHSQYLRARYYSVVTASFLTEASYLGNIREPLTLNRYNYCVSSYLNYVDPSGNLSKWIIEAILGTAVHEKFGEWAEGEFPNAEAKYEVTGYEYSRTGKGYIDLVMYVDGEMEVYELKKYWQTKIYGMDIGEIRQKYKINGGFLPGWKQREGYIRALENMGENVKAGGNSLGEYIMENGLELAINDAYTARFYAYTEQPGMVYYTLFKRPEPEDPIRKSLPVSLPKSGRKARELGRKRTCGISEVPQKAKEGAAIAVLGAGVITLVEKVADAISSAWESGKAAFDNVYFIPMPYEMWDLHLRSTLPSESGKPRYD